MTEPIRDFLEADHRRLDALLRRAFANPDQPDREPYDAFRAGLLRHIAIEEKVLFAEAKRRGAPVKAAAQLRLDHAAIAAILSARPTPELVLELRMLLDLHNDLEESDGGAYAECERAAGKDVDALLARVHAVPPVRVADYIDPARIRAEIGRALDAAYAARGGR